MQPRPFQQKAIDSIFEYFESKDGNPLVVAPTGSGKSVIIALFAKTALAAWPHTRVIVLSHVKELLQQNFEKLLACWKGAPAGLYSVGLGMRQVGHAITIAGIQSVYKKAHLFGWIDLIIIDEAHLLSHNDDTMYRGFITALQSINPKLKIIGLTATPYRLKGGPLIAGEGALFTDICFEIGIAELVAQGYLSPLISKISQYQGDLTNVKEQGGEYVAADIAVAMDKEELTEHALDEVQTFAGDRKHAIYFCSGVNHAWHVGQALNIRGIRAECVTADTPKERRADYLAAFKAGKIGAITNCDVLTTGFDAPNVNLIVMLRPTKSPGLYVQMLGRGMRIAPGKKDCMVLDFAGNIETHGPIDAITPPPPPAAKRKAGITIVGTKICPECRSVTASWARVCIDCGYEYAIADEVKHSATATDAPVMSPEGAPLPTTHEVAKVNYNIHYKPEKPPTLKVTYTTTYGRSFSEWVCIEHQGFARMKAERWWLARAEHGIGSVEFFTGAAVPTSIKEAYLVADKLKKPRKIIIAPRGENKYEEILSYVF